MEDSVTAVPQEGEEAEVNEHAWTTGDNLDLEHWEVIDSGASGEVHEVCR